MRMIMLSGAGNLTRPNVAGAMSGLNCDPFGLCRAIFFLLKTYEASVVADFTKSGIEKAFDTGTACQSGDGDN